MKKFLVGVFASLGLWLFAFAPVYGQWGGGLQWWGDFTGNPNVVGIGGGNAGTINVNGTEAGQQEKILDVIKRFVNYVLALLAFIALIMLLYGGFSMITAAGDEAGYKKGFTILKNAALGIAFIAVAWLIVSLIFFVLNLVTQ